MSYRNILFLAVTHLLGSGSGIPFSTKWIPCIKMALSLQFFIIFPVLNPLRLPITSGLYRLEVGNKLPTSPQDLASKRAPNPPIMVKISQNWMKNQIKSYNKIYKPTYW
jgi:hypothetical protein